MNVRKYTALNHSECVPFSISHLTIGIILIYLLNCIAECMNFESKIKRERERDCCRFVYTFLLQFVRTFTCFKVNDRNEDSKWVDLVVDNFNAF